jgi:hypothetical protein
MSDLHGPKTEFRRSITHIQYRAVDTDDDWVDLIPLSALRGLPGPLGVPTDSAVAINIAGPSATRDALILRAMTTNIRDYGAVGDGTADDTAAIQSALDNTRVGGTCSVPTVAAGKFFKFSRLTIPRGVTLEGQGWTYKRDNVQAFGGANNIDGNTYAGSVLRSTVTTGLAVKTDAEGIVGQSGSIRDLIITGVGTGTATGLAIGSAAGGYGSFETTFENVCVANFSLGVKLTCVEDCVFDGLRIIACQTGQAMFTDTNQNAFLMLDIQRCGNGLTMDSTLLANAFYSPIFQSNTGVSAQLNGSQSAMYNPYFESPAGTLALQIDGYGHQVDTPVLSNVGDGINFGASSSRSHVKGVALYNLAPITIAGSGHIFEGDARTVVDNGSKTRISDTYGDLSQQPGFLVGNSSSTLGERFVVANMSATGEGSSGGIEYRVAGGSKWRQYIAGGDGAKLYLRDQANGRMLVTYTAGATVNTSKVTIAGLLQLASTTTAARPTAAAAGAASVMYDSDLKCLIVSDGSVWRNGVGAAV